MLPLIDITFSGDLFRNFLAIALLVLGLLLNWLYYFRWRTDSFLSYCKRLFLFRAIAITMISFLLLGPVLKIERIQTVKPSFLFLIDRSLSMTLPVWEEGSGEGSRIEVAKERLIESDFLNELCSSADVRFYTFSERVSPVDKDSIFQEARGSASGRTDISGALEWVLENEPEIDGVVVVTDGRINSGGDPRSLLRGDVPIVFLGVGEDALIDDVDITRLNVPSMVYDGSPIPFSVTLHSLIQEAGTATLKLSEGETLLKTIPLELDAGDFYRDVTFSLEGVEEGDHLYTIVVEGLDDERFILNNTRLAAVEVASTRKNVIIVSTTPRWDLSFVVKALRDLEFLSVDLYLLRKGKEEGIFVSGQKKDPVRLSVRDLDLGGYDLICLQGNIGDLSVLELSGSFEQFIKPGKGVFILLTEGLQKRWSSNNRVRDLLPLSITEPVSIIEGRFDIVPPTMDPTRLTTLHPDTERNLSVWSSLPPLTGRVDTYLDGRSKAVLVNLITVRGKSNEEFPAIVTEDRNGFRVVSFLGRGFWRWSFHRSSPEGTGYYYRKFLDSLVGWALNGSEEGDKIELIPAKKLFLQGESVEFISKGESGQEEEIYLVIGREIDGAIPDTFLLGSGSPGDNRDTLAFNSLSPGRYYFHYGTSGADIMGDGSLQVDTYSTDYSDPRPDNRFLEELGAGMNGEYVNINNINKNISLQLASNAKSDKRTMRTFVIYKMPILYLMILLFLISELLLRKMKGLS